MVLFSVSIKPHTTHAYHVQFSRSADWDIKYSDMLHIFNNTAPLMVTEIAHTFS